MYKKNWSIFTTILIFPYALIYIGNALVSTENLALLVLGALITIVGFVLSVVAYTSLVKSVHDLETNPSAIVSVKDQYSFGFKIFWSVILVGIIQALVSFGSLALFLIPAIIVGVYVTFSYFGVVLDGKKGFSALTESFSLVRGRWWKILWRIIFVALVNLLLSVVIMGIQFLLSSLTGYQHNSSTDIMVSSILNMILVLFYMPIGVAYLYKLYRTLKETEVAEISTVVFKRWLVTFLVVGIVAIVMLPVFVVTVIGSSVRARQAAIEAVMRAKAQQDAIQQEISGQQAPAGSTTQ
ncbi:MAG: hypothetical protein NT077_00110 [Candidatus Taylorbacteria bacterium]|nr:hypothetical protein [Candidatus Taylorbacteria bacterium]